MRLRHVADRARATPARASAATASPSSSDAAALRRRAGRGCVLNSVVLPPPFGPSRHSTSPPPTREATRRGRPRLPRIAEGEVARLEPHGAHCQLRRAPRAARGRTACRRTRSARRAGSRCGAIVRASVSTASRKPAPSSIAAGSRRAKSGPTSRRAKCGISSPIQPIDAARSTTAAAVISVAAAITTRRTRRVVDAERARLLVAERQHVDAPAQQPQRHEADQHRRAAVDARSPRLTAGEAAEQPERDRRQLVVGIGQVLEQRDARRRAARRPTTPASTSTRIGSWPRTRGADQRRRAPTAARPDGEGEALDRRRPAATGRCRAPRRAPRRRTRRGCRARPADCGTGSGRPRRRRPARRRPASAASDARAADAERPPSRPRRAARARAPVSFAQSSASEIAGRDRIAADRERRRAPATSRRGERAGRTRERQRGAASCQARALGVAPAGASSCASVGAW